MVPRVGSGGHAERKSHKCSVYYKTHLSCSCDVMRGNETAFRSLWTRTYREGNGSGTDKNLAAAAACSLGEYLRHATNAR